MVSRTPQFLDLVQRISDAFATLRDVRLTVLEMRKTVWLDDDVCKMIEANQPSGAGRWGGYGTDEQLVSEWTGAMTKLLTDGDTLMPGDSYKIESDSPVTKTVITTGFVTDNVIDTINPSSPVRRDARDRVSARKVRRTRANGKRSGSSPRASRPARNRDPGPPVAERDPVTGKWHKTTAAEPTPPPSQEEQ